MKIAKILGLLCLATLTTFSCKKDEETPIQNVSGLKYETYYYEIVTSYPGTSRTDTKATKAELEAIDKYEKIEFKANGDFYINNVKDGKWSQSGKIVLINSVYFSNTDFASEVKFEVSGSDLFYTFTESLGDYKEVSIFKYRKL